MHILREDSAGIQTLGELAWRYRYRELSAAASARRKRRVHEAHIVLDWHSRGVGAAVYIDVVFDYAHADNAAGDGGASP